MKKHRDIFPTYYTLENDVWLSILLQFDNQKYPWRDSITWYNPYEEPGN